MAGVTATLEGTVPDMDAWYILNVSLHLRKPEVYNDSDDELEDCHLHGQQQGVGPRRR